MAQRFNSINAGLTAAILAALTTLCVALVTREMQATLTSAEQALSAKEISPWPTPRLSVRRLQARSNNILRRELAGLCSQSCSPPFLSRPHRLLSFLRSTMAHLPSDRTRTRSARSPFTTTTLPEVFRRSSMRRCFARSPEIASAMRA